MNLGSLKYADGSRRPRKRVGRGQGSGKGKTCGRGHNGQMSRAGAKHRAWFEGGQMPIQRRLPKRGFCNIRRQENQIVNLNQIEALAGKESVISPEILLNYDMIQYLGQPVKILSDGDIKTAFEFENVRLSKAALAKVEAAGGKLKVA
jgi:large subunit ribosomal protein L15